MKVQHAPLPVQAALLEPNSVAPVIAQRNSGGTGSPRKPATGIGSSTLTGDENKLRLSHAVTRTTERPPGWPRGAAAASVMRASGGRGRSPHPEERFEELRLEGHASRLLPTCALDIADLG